MRRQLQEFEEEQLKTKLRVIETINEGFKQAEEKKNNRPLRRENYYAWELCKLTKDFPTPFNCLAGHQATIAKKQNTNKALNTTCWSKDNNKKMRAL